MDPTIGGIVGGAIVAMLAGVFGIRQARILETERAKAAANTLTMEAAKVRIDGFDRLADRQEHEIARLIAVNAEERAIAEAFSAKAERLEGERDRLRTQVEFCQTHHTGGTEP